MDSLRGTDWASQKNVLRKLARTDLYFLLRYICGREDIEHPWLYERCREVQRNPDGYLDLWSREHYKSTIITFGKTLQDILASHGEDAIHDRELTFGIFSHSRPIAVKFLAQIKQECEGNSHLKNLFDDVLWSNPGAEAPKWSVYAGLVFRRKSNPKEATLEAYGLVDGMPTSAHFDVLVYDDVVTVDGVRSPEMIEKTTHALELSYNLGARGGKRRMIGTRYHFNDSYKTVLDRGTFKPRIYAATDDGTLDGEPVFLSRAELDEKRRDQGPYTFACQMMQNPVADATQGFRREWLRFYQNRDGAGMNKYILVDPASEKKRHSDRTAMAVIGLAADENYYLLDFVYDRLNLTERTSRLFELHQKWKPQAVAYEKYGKDSDIEHIQAEQERRNYRFSIEPVGGSLAKVDRIKRLIPVFEQSRFYLPETIMFTDHEGKTRDLVEQLLVEEYDAFPVGLHDDGLDAIARIFDLPTSWPRIDTTSATRYGRKRSYGSSWAA